MTFQEYVKARGLTESLIAQKAGKSRQAVNQYGKTRNPSANTLHSIAKAMTELGVETKVVDLVPLFYKEDDEEGDK